MKRAQKDIGRTVLVTGAAGGLGSAVCCRLANAGYCVLACDIAPLQTEDERIVPVLLDVTSDESVADCVKKAEEITDCLYAVINLAGVFYMTTLSEGGAQQLSRALEVNVVGMCRLNSSLMPLLKPGKSRIINMSSEIGRYSPQPFNGPYAVSKHAADVYTDVLRRELMFAGIPVCKIQAGSFGTQMLNIARTQYDALLENTQLYRHELTVLAPIMTGELEKGYNPDIFARMILRQLRRRKPKRCVRIKNSLKLSLLDALPEGAQDIAYKAALKVFGWFTKDNHSTDIIKENENGNN